ncbi:MAG: BTAD domain-containing putative transcriptional regulator [Roseiflexaceae bacterium]
MDYDRLLLRTRLTPPRVPGRAFARPALAARLRAALDHRLTLVQAGTGYGKTTALAALDLGGVPRFWYSVGEGDTDPQRFLSYLIGAFRTRLPDSCALPLALLQERGQPGERAIWLAVVEALINGLDEALDGPALLVLDDWHLAAGAPEVAALLDHFLAHLPADLHVAISTRHPITSPAVARMRARGDLLEIDRAALAFQPDEVEALFRQSYGLRLAPTEVAALIERTEGWPIALQLVWQGLRNGTARNAADLLAAGPAPLAALFDYLALDVLARQPPELAAFLRETAVLRELTPDACDAVRALPPDQRAGPLGSAALLDRLHEQDLFVIGLGEHHYRYHQLFHEFLRQQAGDQPEALEARHRRAAGFFQQRGLAEEQIYHHLAAADIAAAAAAIETAGEAALQAGRLDTVAQWIDALPPEILAARPLLLIYQGDICRLRSAFDQAHACYRQAEQVWRACGDNAGIGRALRAQARVYLDTVQPARAEQLLEEALRLSDGTPDREARARLLDLLAENKLNMGDPPAAERLRNQARALRDQGPGDDGLSVRVMLRTGRLDEARRILESWLADERRAASRGQVHPPRSHRESVLVLALIEALSGQAARATALAQEGIDLGERLGSPFVTAVAYMRLGHARQISPAPGWPPERQRAYDEAIGCYQRSIDLGDRLAVRRMRAEAMWGLTRAYAACGDLESARRAAVEGSEVARTAGDLWVAALVDLALGAGYLLAGQPAEAAPVFGRAQQALSECGDLFARAAARVWQALAYHELRQPEHFAACMDEALGVCEARGYDFLFTGATLLGPPDPRRWAPALIEARTRHIRPAYTARLLAALGLGETTLHPGYRLRVQTLGVFRVWRGEAEVEPREWQRDKARQLFQLLLTRRDRWLQRDEIAELLWPDLAPEAASRDFKVALNALNKALEPGRAPEAASAFVARDGTAYRLRPEADLWLDAAAFARSCDEGLRLLERPGPPEDALERLRAALLLYGGDYLPDTRYDDWPSQERERLLALYLRGADRLATALLERGRNDEVIDLCRRILEHDPCWEQAYRLTMRACLRQGNRAQALRAYQRCCEALRDELGVEPAPETRQLFEEARRQQ